MARIGEWLAKLDPKELADIAEHYFRKPGLEDRSSLEDRHSALFGGQAPPRFNRTQRIVLIGQEVRGRVLDVAKFLRGYGLDIYCMQFTYHETDGGEKLLLTEMTLGQDEPGELARAQDEQNSRQRNRRVAKMLCTDLNERFGDRLQVPFQIYQERSGSAGDAHTTIQTDNYRMGLDFVVDGPEAIVQIHSRLKTTHDAIVEWVQASGLLQEFEGADFNPSRRAIVLIDLQLPSDSGWKSALVEQAVRVTEAVLKRTE